MYKMVMHHIDSNIHSAFGALRRDHHEAEDEQCRVVFRGLSLYDPVSHGILHGRWIA